MVAVYDRDITALLPKQVAYRWPASAAPVNVPLTDGIAPVLPKAEMLGDTLRLSFSEPFNIGANSNPPADLFVYRLNQAGADFLFPPSAVQWNPTGDGRIEDNYDNGVGPNSRFRLITGTKNSEIKTVTYMKVEPTKVVANPAPIVTSPEPSNARVEEVVDRTARLLHLIKVDLGDHAQADDFTPVDPSKVFLEYHVGYFSNFGVPVASEKRTLFCLNPLFNGDGRANRKYLFVGWKFNSLKNQRVATGAYVARIQYKVMVAGNSPVTGELDQVWGMLRGN